jgi:hypothetical protein
VSRGPRPVLEPVRVPPGAFDAVAMARGEPGVPLRFAWRGRDYRVVEVLDSTRELGPCRHGSGETYVRRHTVRVRTDSGEVMVLAAARDAGRRRPRWLLRSVEPATP